MSGNSIEDTSSTGRRKILVVGTGPAFSADTMEYSIHLAERLDYDLLAMTVCPTGAAKAYIRQARNSSHRFKSKASSSGILYRHVIKAGDLSAAVEELNHEVKRIEFVVADSEVNTEEIAREVTIPMFGVISNSLTEQGGKIMAKEQVSRKKTLVRTIGFGLLTAAMYAAVFANTGPVMTYFTKGGLYAALPISTVFLFSFAHGAFASSLWSLLGIEAMKKDALRATEAKVVEQRKKARKKPRAYAYVNPFHRL